MDDLLWGELANGPAGLHCLGCEVPYAERSRQNTQFSDDQLNYADYCTACQADMDAYWAERWADYYGTMWLTYGCSP